MYGDKSPCTDCEAIERHPAAPAAPQFLVCLPHERLASVANMAGKGRTWIPGITPSPVIMTVRTQWIKRDASVVTVHHLPLPAVGPSATFHLALSYLSDPLVGSRSHR